MSNRMDIDEDGSSVDYAMTIEDSNPGKASDIYMETIKKVSEDPEVVAEQLRAIYRLAGIYAKKESANDLKALIIKIRPFFLRIPKAKTAKCLKELLKIFAQIKGTEELQADFCRETIQWCVKEQRTFLKLRVQARLVQLLLDMKNYKEALRLIARVSREVKKIDDKILLVEISLLESQIHLALANVPKAKAAMTCARSAANAIYCPPRLQASIDMQAGILCSEEEDYKTAFSYFYEGFEGFDSAKVPGKAAACMKYMLLVKIMTDNSEEVYSIINSKGGMKYAGVQIEAMKAIADAHKKRSIHAFQDVRKKYATQLEGDFMISSHISMLEANLLVSNLIRIIEPFSKVEIAHVAKLIDLPLPLIEAKLSEMILDNKLKGILDQGSGYLIIFDETPVDKTYKAGIDTVKELGSVVDKLFNKAKALYEVKTGKLKTQKGGAKEPEKDKTKAAA